MYKNKFQVLEYEEGQLVHHCDDELIALFYIWFI